MAEEIIRHIDIDEISEAVCEGLVKANLALPKDIIEALENAKGNETEPLPCSALHYMMQNIDVAKEKHLPVCQDTGMVTVFAHVGQLVHIAGGTLEEAIQNGVKQAYGEHYLRCSVVDDPLFSRKNTGNNTPAMIHITYEAGNQLRLFCIPKGFGSENMSCLKMFSPHATADDILLFAVDAVKKAGANPCPPIVLGIGIGGTFDSVTRLAKEALLSPVQACNEHPEYAELERKILAEVNKCGVGPQGFGGNTTALAVHIKTAPTHVAGLPVAICFSCYACRKAEILI